MAWRGTGGRGGSLVTRGPEGSFGLSLMQTGGKARCGTPGYMAPEVYRGEGADIRSDIYSFGLVLWQMAAGSPVPPFVAPYRGDLEGYMREIYEQQMTGHVPRVDGFLGPVIQRCLCPKTSETMDNFAGIAGGAGANSGAQRRGKARGPAGWREDDNLLEQQGRFTRCPWSAREAISCLDQALAIDPRNAAAWTDKGNALDTLGGAGGAGCCDQALAIDPRFAQAWNNKGNALNGLGRHEEAIRCYDQALAIDPRYAKAWYNKGNALAKLGRHEEALACYDQALAIDPRLAEGVVQQGHRPP